MFMVTIDRWTGMTVVDAQGEYLERFSTVHGALEQLTCVAAASLMVDEARIEVETEIGRLPIASFGDIVANPAYFLEVPIRALSGETIAFFSVRGAHPKASSEFDVDVLSKLADSAQRKLMLAWSESGPQSVL